MAVCRVCSKEDAKACTGCRSVHYCSRECQRKDWKEHKKLCAKSISPAVATSEATRVADKDNSNNCSVPKNLKKSDTDGIIERNQSMIADYAMEYMKRFPKEVSRVATLRMERLQALVRLAAIKEGFEAYTDDDYEPGLEKCIQRWNTADLEGLLAFKKRPDLKDGDIWDCDPMSYSTACSFDKKFKVDYQQILRNTPSSTLLLQFGKNYVGIGYVDLCQLLWGEYQNEGSGILRFYGYDQAEVTVARSVLIYEMMNIEELSDKSILQIWFSSCWDSETQQQFYSFINKHVPKINNPLLTKYAHIWKKKKGMTVKEAQNAFAQHRRSCDFMPLNNLFVMNDRVQFANYLFTGCLFMDPNRPDDVVCGNVTMFPGASESWMKLRHEDFFNSIDMSAIFRGTSAEKSDCKSVMSMIVKATELKLKILRTFVKDNKVVCNFTVKEVRTKDSSFARGIKDLDPYFIDWSNLPDYFPRLDFIELARKCSGPETLHNFHTMNWVCKVYGASFFDFIDRREQIENMYRRYKLGAAFFNQMMQAMCPQNLEGLIRCPKFDLPMNEFSAMAVELHGDKYLKHIMTDKKGKLLNFVKCPFNHYWQIFGDNDTLMICTFSFDEKIRLTLHGISLA